MTKIRAQMKSDQEAHDLKMRELERSLMETHATLQAESTEKVKQMELAAKEKATGYLSAHTAAILADNKRLEQELAKLTAKTQETLKRKEKLERENVQLEAENKLRTLISWLTIRY